MRLLRGSLEVLATKLRRARTVLLDLTGMPAVDIIDFDYGSAPGLNDYWHTAKDTVDKLSEESLGTIGRVTIRVINSIVSKAK